MISIQSEIEGKEARYGDIEEIFSREGFVLGGGWDYFEAYFDCALERDGGETIYLRLPVEVMNGQLDDAGAELKFKQPFLIRHVVNTGLTKDEPEPTTIGSVVVQFQPPLESDGEIHNRDQRVEKAKQAIQKLLPYLH